MGQIKAQAKALIDQLPDEAVAGLLGFIQSMQKWEATREIEEDQQLQKAIAEGQAAIAQGKTVRWRDVRRKV